MARVLAPGEDAEELARSADADVLGVAGGDGSLAAVATVAIDRRLPFVCVPFGTYNHFARDLGLDREDPIRSLDSFDGEERRVDVGRVGGRMFLNNVSFGVYASLVHRRERRERRRLALASARALWRVAREREALRLDIDGSPMVARVVVVANNAYELDLFSLGARSSLSDGVLCLYTANGWLPSAWETRRGRRFRIGARRREIEAAIDGEPVRLRPPLEFALEPQALRVLVPQR
jgi:diacylglycerol kinase family enzyme